MHFHWWTFALQTANFLVLVWLLQRFLYRPVLAAVDRRRREIEAGMREVAAARQATDVVRREVDRVRATIDQERDQMLTQAREDARAERTSVLERTQREAAALLAGARVQLDREREDAAKALQDQAAELAVTIARQLLVQTTHGLATESFLDEALDELEAIPETERRMLLQRPLKVASAAPLTPSAEAACRARLARMAGADVAVAFVHDSALLGGVELHLGDSILHHAWRDALADTLRELTSHGDAH